MPETRADTGRTEKMLKTNRNEQRKMRVKQDCTMQETQTLENSVIYEEGLGKCGAEEWKR